MKPSKQPSRFAEIALSVLGNVIAGLILLYLARLLT
jgi:hypothetical protein